MDFAERRDRRMQIRQAYDLNMLPDPPCYSCQFRYEEGDIPSLDGIKQGVHPSSNGYSEYLLCEECFEATRQGEV